MRCMADIEAVQYRENVLEPYRAVLTHQGVDLTDCFYYNLLPIVLPKGDPGERPSHPAS